jgi:hypothetical protein
MYGCPSRHYLLTALCRRHHPHCLKPIASPSYHYNSPAAVRDEGHRPSPILPWHLSGLSSTLPSPGLTSPTRSSRCLHMHDHCEPHLTVAKHILRYLLGTLDHGLLLHASLRRTSSSTLTLTKQVAPTLIDPLLAIRCFLATTSSPGPRNAKTSSLVRALRRSTVSWPTTWQSRAGFVSCSWSYTAPVAGSTMTTSALSSSPPTPPIFNAPNMLRLIFTSSASALLLEMFMSSTS